MPPALVHRTLVVLQQLEHNILSRIHPGHPAVGDGVVAGRQGRVDARGDVQPTITATGPVRVVVVGGEAVVCDGGAVVGPLVLVCAGDNIWQVMRDFWSTSLSLVASSAFLVSSKCNFLFILFSFSSIFFLITSTFSSISSLNLHTYPVLKFLLLLLV